ncbi:MAG: DUF4292 domain-containing protein [Bacteroidota bacterium]
MNLTVRMWVGCILALASLTSCAPRKFGVLLDTEQISPTELLAMVEAGGEKLRSMSGRGSLAFESPEFAGSAFFSLSLKKPDSLLLKLEGPFGIDMGMLFMDREKYLIYNGLENRVIRGSPQGSSFRSLIPIDLTHEQLLEAISGVFTIKGDAQRAREFTVEEDRFRLLLPCGNEECIYWIDPGSLLVTRYLRRTASGTTLVDAVSDAITEQDDIFAPRRITVVFPESQRRVSVYYSALHLNDPEPSFSFSVPPDAETIDR